MSMKIYDGIKFHTKSIKSLYRDIDMLRIITRNHLLEIISSLTTITSRKFELNSILNQRDNLVEIIIFHHKKSFYGILYIPSEIADSVVNTTYDMKSKQLRSKLFATNLFRDYYYWDNTDKPECISLKDWRTRKKVWEGIFSNGSIPCEVGLSAQLTPTYILL